MQNVFIKGSDVQGKGVFAARNFHPGDEILEIDDSHIVEEETMLTKEDWEYNTDFLDGRIIIMQEPERCINHSCDPNSYMKTIKKVRKLFAMKEIVKGEEITCDYSLNSDNEGTFACRCGAKRCRKVYVGNYFKLPGEIQIEYLPYLEDWFVDLHKDKIDALKNISLR
jgi:hypothetical protein